MEATALRERLRQARTEGLQLVAAVASPAGGDGRGGAAAVKPYWELDWRRATVLMMGNEGSGLAPDLEAIADQRVTVPHDPAVESLNVAVAAAPLLLERCRQDALKDS
jgi:TrmH family RNA methyltransferase